MNNDNNDNDGGSKIDPGHNKPRNVLRIVGPIILGLGVLLIVIGIASFFMSMGGFEPPKYFWCAFLGIPLVFVGGVMTQFGYMGKVARYAAGEMAPVAKDTFNYVATESKEGITAVAGAIGQGLKDGGISLGAEIKDYVRCHKCNSIQDADAKFCDDCGTTLVKNKQCPICNELNDPDAKFCDNCGHRFTQER